MKRRLNLLLDELKRLKAEGVRTIPVSEATLERLRERAASLGRSPVAGQSADSAVSPPSRTTTTSPLRGSMPVAVSHSSRAAGQKLPNGIAPIPQPIPFTLPDGDKATRWEALRRIVIESPVCREHAREGCKVVFGVGSLDADIFFVGEAPGAEEEIQGEPFVGPAGELLTRMINAMSLARGDVYIGNIMNWRPEHPNPVGNRPPTAAEMAFCLPYLVGQISIVRPKALVALGSTASQGLFGEEARGKAMRDLRGRWRDFAGVPCMITYHPSYILRNGSTAVKRTIWEDLLQVMERTGLKITEKQRRFFT